MNFKFKSTDVLSTSIIFSMGGNGFYAASQWGIIILIARQLGAAELGRYTLVLALCWPVFTLLHFSLRQLLVTDTRHEFSFFEYRNIRVMTSILAVVVVVGIGFIIDLDVAIWQVLAGLVMFKYFESLSDISYGLWQLHQRLDLCATSLALRGFLSLASVAVVLLVFKETIGVAAAGIGLSNAVVWIFHDRVRSQKFATSDGLAPTFSSSERSSRLLRVIKIAVPLTASAVLLALSINVPRYFIENQLGLEALGIFASLIHIVTLGGIVMNSAGQAMISQLSSAHQDGNAQRFKFLTGILVVIAIIMVAAGTGFAMLIGEPVLGLLYGAEFAAHNKLFIVVMFMGGLGYLASAMGYAATAQRIFRPMLGAYAVSIVAIVVGCFWLVPPLGLDGAVYAIGTSNAVISALLGLLVFRAMQRGADARMAN